ncbi:MAG: phosphodiester glycosidase family protein [Firmicutes bacterium]|nr:phosphodiester glycosidase family protein [Bacillota bacterium]
MDGIVTVRSTAGKGKFKAVMALFVILCLGSGGQVLANAAAAASCSLESFVYFVTDDKIVADFKFTEPVRYALDYSETTNEITIDLPGVNGAGFYTEETVSDSVLYKVTVSPYSAALGEGVRVVLSLRHKVPDPLAFRVSQGKRLLVESKKEFRDGFETHVVPGLAYGHWRKDTPNGPLFVNYMRIDLREPGVRVRPAMAANGKEAVHQLAARHGAIAAVNGIYFASDGSPLGMIMIDGKLVSPPYLNRTAAGLTENGTVIIDNVAITGEVRRAALGAHEESGGQKRHLEVGSWSEATWEIDGVNRRRLADELIIYTAEHGTTTGTNNYGWEVLIQGNYVTGHVQGNAKIPPGGYVISGHGKAAHWLRNLEIGDYIDASWSLQPNWLEQGVVHAVGGGPRLLRQGQVDITAEQERFQADITQGRAPRTALGVTERGELLLVTVNGRQNNISIGMTLAEAAELMRELGAIEAMNLDGGGSSTMVVRGIVLNAPSDGVPRPVSNAILVWADGGVR